MQTFLPYISFRKSAEVLDDRRLGKQILEVQQILTALDQGGGGYFNHPAVQMWSGHERSLCMYGLAFTNEWTVNRGNAGGYLEQAVYFAAQDRRLSKWLTAGPYNKPPWVGDLNFHRSHRSNLIRKLHDYYFPFFPNTPVDMPYLWPDLDGQGGYTLKISKAEAARSEDWYLPDWLSYDPTTREVKEDV